MKNTGFNSGSHIISCGHKTGSLWQTGFEHDVVGILMIFKLKYRKLTGNIELLKRIFGLKNEGYTTQDDYTHRENWKQISQSTETKVNKVCIIQIYYWLTKIQADLIS